MNQHIARPFTLLILLSCTPAHASSTTPSGNEFGVSLGFYRYEEPGLMSLQGLKGGFDLRTTKAYPNRHTFLRGELRYAGGSVDYASNGTGSSSGETDWYIEGRALIGRDWSLNESTLSSYFGIGYRFLLNDGRGITSTGAAGYRRESNYLYLPIGFILISELHGGDALKTTVEYDHLMSGKQFTRLSDTSLGYADLNNQQNSGYGIKLRLTYAKQEWFAGPYLHYWNIAASEVNPVYQNGIFVGYGVEPKNKTTEFGIEFGRPF